MPMRVVSISLLLFSFYFLGASPAVAIAGFQRIFMKQYADKEKNPEYYKKVKETKCWVCHQFDTEKPKSKKKHNHYGEELAKLLDKKKDKKDQEKIIAALKTVAAKNSVPKDKKSPTYGELIKQGKLPTGKYTGPPKKDEEKKAP